MEKSMNNIKTQIALRILTRAQEDYS